MSGERDFLKEIKELNAETDQKVAQVLANIPISGKPLLDQILEELKNIRLEMRGIDAKINRKFEELKKEIDEKFETQSVKMGRKFQWIKETQEEKSEELKTDLTEIIETKSGEMLQKIEESEGRNRKKLAEINRKLQMENQKLDDICSEVKPIQKYVSNKIRQAILGEWQMEDSQNFNGWKNINPDQSFELFSENLKYSTENGLLKQTGGSYQEAKEGGTEFGGRDLFVEDNHLKTVTCIQNIDRYIEDGKLHVITHEKGDVWERVYVKV